MPNKCYHVHLSAVERQQLDAFVKHGHKSARQINRARILLLADAHTRDEDIAALLSVSLPTIYKMRKKYCQNTSASVLDLLQEQPRSGQPLKVDTHVASHVAMIACSDPPEGQARWTLQLIADKLVTLHVVDSICVESVRKALKKTSSNPGSRNAGVWGR
jgi:transposase